MNYIRIFGLITLLATGTVTQALAADSSPVFKRAINCTVPDSAPTGGGVVFDLFGPADLTGSGAIDVIYATGSSAPTLVNLPEGGGELLITANVEMALAANNSKALTFKFNVAGYDAVLRFNTVTKVSTLAVGDPKEFAITCKTLLKL